MNNFYFMATVSFIKKALKMRAFLSKQKYPATAAIIEINS